jgi:hypothetical protein
MPTVPRVTGPSVLPEPSRPVFQSSAGASGFESVGGGARRAAADLERFSSSIADSAIRSQIEDNERHAKDLDISFAERVRLLTHGDGSAQNPGYYSSRGQAALDGNNNVKKAIVEARRELMKSAKNPQVVEMFDLASRMRLNREVETIDRFTNEQRRVADDTTSQARVNSAANDAAAAWNDAKVLGQSRAIIRAEVVDMAERNGWAPEIARMELRKAETEMFKLVITAAEAVDPVQAFSLFSAHEDSIEPATRTALRNLLKDGVLAQKSQEITDAIMAEAATKGWSQNQTLARVRAVLQGKEEDDVVQRVSQRFAERYQEMTQARTARSEQRQLAAAEAKDAAPHIALTLARMFPSETEALDAAAETYSGEVLHQVNQEIRLRFAAQTRTAADTRKEARSAAWDAIDSGASLSEWKQQNPAAFDMLETNDLDALQRYEIRVTEGQPFARTTDPARWQQLRQMNAGALAQVDANAEKMALNKSDWNQLLTMIEGAKKSLEVNTDRLSTQIAFGSAELTRLTARRKMKPEDRNQIENQIRAFIVQNQRQHPDNRPPSDEAVTREVATLLMRAKEDFLLGMWFPESGTVASLRARAAQGEITPQEKARIFVPVKEIPEIVMNDLVEKMEEYGVPYSDELAQQLAGALAMQDGPRVRRLLGIGE